MKNPDNNTNFPKKRPIKQHGREHGRPPGLHTRAEGADGRADRDDHERREQKLQQHFGAAARAAQLIDVESVPAGALGVPHLQAIRHRTPTVLRMLHAHLQ